MNTVLNVKIDPNLKLKAQAVAKDLGIPMSLVVTAGLREFIHSRSITISDTPRLKPEVAAELLKIVQKTKAGTLDEYSPAFTELTESFEWLDEK